MKKMTSSNKETVALLHEATQMARRYGRIGSCDPDDIAQMAMLKVLKQPAWKARPRKWLFVVVQNTAFDVRRQFVREAKYVMPVDDTLAQLVCERVDEQGYVHVGAHHNPRPEGLGSEILLVLEGVLQQLTEPLREVLCLSAEGLSYEQIAQKTQSNLGTVRSRLHYARRKAQRLLAEVLCQ